MSSPLGQGDLWRRVSNHYKEQLVVITTIGDIRSEQVRVSRRISWERTALELVDELTSGMNVYLKCRHLIVWFGPEGALWLDNSDPNDRRFQLIFDPIYMEREWGDQIEGRALGYSASFTLGILHQFIINAQNPDIEEGIRSGLSAMRILEIEGHGNGSQVPTGFPLASVSERVINNKKQDPNLKFDYATVTIPEPKRDSGSELQDWTVLSTYSEEMQQRNIPLFGLARQVALKGLDPLKGIPRAQFGKLLTIDRNDIEILRGIRTLIKDYNKQDSEEKPLSIAVFGPPGSGKSFGIKEIAKGILGEKVSILEFNLSQFDNQNDLIGAFHQIRDKALEGELPLVFWDEFDSKEYMWLQYLLSPMQDGKFQQGQVTHPIGKCIFIFAGGTSYDMENFGPSKEDKEGCKKFAFKKGPDFISRLNGYYNVLGPNQRREYRKIENEKDAEKSVQQCPLAPHQYDKKDWLPDERDVCFPIRRALLIRGMLRLKENQPLKIDRDLLSALLEVDTYKHGARSLEKILMSIKQADSEWLKQSNLPPKEVMSIHTDYDQFLGIVNRNQEYKTKASQVAPMIHNEFYRNWVWEYVDTDLQKLNFNQIDQEDKDSNIAAATRIPDVLELVGLYVVPSSFGVTTPIELINKIIEDNIDVLAEAEHDGWMDFKLKNDWRKDKDKRDNIKKFNKSLIPYRELKDPDPHKDAQKYDKDIVRNYSAMLKSAGYKIVMTLKEDILFEELSNKVS